MNIYLKHTAIENYPENLCSLEDPAIRSAPHSIPAYFWKTFISGEPRRPTRCLGSPRFENFEGLPQGAVVGTSSLRRTVLLRALRPDVHIEPPRGNLDTRLKKLDEGQYAGMVLDSAGLKRLGLNDRIQ